MKYLITGGCGFLGSNIAEKLLINKADVIIVDNMSRTSTDLNLDWLKTLGNFKFYKADVKDSFIIDEIVKGEKPDIIFHLAGQVAMTTSISNPKLDFETNAMGSLNVLEAVRKYSPNTGIIYSSTNKVYGDLEYLNYEEQEKRYICQEFPQGFNENIKLDFHSPYGCSKGAADQYMLDYNRIFGIKTIVFRHSSMFGLRQFSTYDQGWIGWFCQKAIEAKSGEVQDWTISGNGKQVRDVLFSEDATNLYVKATESIEKAQGQVFNIGGGMKNSLSLLELFDILESSLHVKLQYKNLPPRESDQKIFVADITKASEFFDWNVKTNKHEGIEKVLKWLTKI